MSAMTVAAEITMLKINPATPRVDSNREKDDSKNEGFQRRARLEHGGLKITALVSQ